MSNIEKKKKIINAKKDNEVLLKVLDIVKALISNKIISFTLLGIVLFLTIRFVLIPFYQEYNQEHTSITSVSSLTKIIKLSKISTCESEYNGIAYVYSPDDKEHKEDPLYLVAYKSKVKAGIDMQDIEVNEDKENKKFIIVLPEITISTPSVDISNMEIMFKDKKSNTESVSKDAYAAAEEDAKKECENNSALKELARDNLENMIRGLTEPLLEQTNVDYEIEFQVGESNENK